MSDKRWIGTSMLILLLAGMLFFGTPQEINNAPVITGLNLISNGDREITKFNINNGKVTEQDMPANIEVKDSKGDVMLANIDIREDNIVLQPEKIPINEIEFNGLDTDELVELRLEDTPEDKEVGFEEVYSIDPTSLNFTNATVKVTATGTKLFKCKEWDFDNQKCLGRWKKIKNIVPGEEYDFTLTADDPGFGESNESIIILDSNDYLINSSQTLLANNTEIYNINITPKEYIDGTISEIVVYGYNSSSSRNEIAVEKNFTTDKHLNSYAIDPTNLAFDNATVKVNAKGKSLYKCTEWNFTTQSCYSRWKKIKNIVPGEEYDFTLTADDPGFGEGNYSIEILDEENYLQNYTESVISNNRNISDIQVNISGGPITNIVIYGHNESKGKNELRIKHSITNNESIPTYSTNNTDLMLAYSIDPTNLAFDNATVTITARSSDVYKCKNWNFTTQSCIDGNWTLFRSGLTPGQTYTFTLTPEDPGFGEVIQPDLKDGYIKQDRPTENYGATSLLEVKTRSPAKNARALLHFNVSLPSGVRVDNAALELYVTSAPGTTRTYDAHRMTSNWNEGTGDGVVNDATVNGTTWNERSYLTNWAAAGGDYAATATDSIATGTTANVWLSWNITDDVKGMYNGSYTNYGWLIKDNAEEGANIKTQFVSKEDLVNTAFWPRLTINYTDIEAPNITILSPINKNYSVSNISINYTVTDNINVSSCWYSLDGGANTSLPGCANTTMIVSASGDHALTVYANDTNNNIGFDLVNFTIYDLDVAEGYSSGDTITVSGNGWGASNNITVNITDPLGDMLNADNHTLITNTTQGFTYTYPLGSDPEAGQYTVFVHHTADIGTNLTAYFNVTDKPRVVNVTDLPDPANISQIISINTAVSSTEAIDSVWVSINNTDYSMTPVTGGYEYNYSSVVETSLPYIVYANNSIGVIGNSETYYINVINSSASSTVNITLNDHLSVNHNVTYEIIDVDTNLAVVNQTSTNLVSTLGHGKYDMIITPVDSPIQKITLDNATVYSGTTSIIDFENITPTGSFERAFAINPRIGFDRGTVTLTAQANNLYKCANWTFATQTCNDGVWTLFKSGLTPGQNYTFTIAPGDPGFGEVQQPGLGDAMIREDKATTTYGATTPLTIRSRSPAKNRRALLQFNISLPSGVRVDNAALDLYMTTAPATTRTYDAHRMTSNWNEGTGDGVVNDAIVNGTTWNERSYLTNWAAAGGDYSATATSSVASGITANVWLSWNVTNDVKGMYNGSYVNNGWLIKDNAEGDVTGPQAKFVSKEDLVQTTFWPRLTINYTDITAPNITILSPVNKNYSVSNISINYTVTDNLGPGNISQCWYSVNSGANVSLPGCLNTSVLLSDGTKNFIIYSNDTTGNIGNNSISFTVDTTAPALAINNPLNGNNYSNATVFVNISASDVGVGIDKIWFFNGTANETYTVPVYRTYNEGSNTIYAYANDTLGNLNSTNVTFTIDTTAPTVTVYQPNGTYNLTINIPLEYAATNGGGVDSCWYSIDGGTDIPLAGCLNTTINISTVGVHNLTVYANDTLNNIGSYTNNFTALYYNTTLFLNESSDPVENGQLFKLIADYEYENGTDILNAACTDKILNKTILTNYDGPLDYEENFTQDHWEAVAFENIGSNTYNKDFKVEFHLSSLGNISNKNLNIWVMKNASDWNSSLTPDAVINGTAYPLINETNQEIYVNLNDSIFSTQGDYTVFFACVDCNTTERYRLGRDEDNFGHSYQINNITAPVSWDNFSLINHEMMVEIKMTPRLLNMTYSAPDSAYIQYVLMYLSKETSKDYIWEANCTKPDHINLSNTAKFTIANNYAPQPNITSISPDPVEFNVENATVIWTNDHTGLAFKITSSYVNLTYPNGTFIAQFNGNPFDINGYITGTGTYNLTAFADNNIGSNTSTAYFTVQDTLAPSLSIISPNAALYNNATILVNLSASDVGVGIDKIWFFNGTANETYTVPVYRTYNEGSNTLHAYANDTLGNLNGTNVTFTIDATTPPEVNITLPITNTSYNINGTVAINVNATDGTNVSTALANITWTAGNELLTLNYNNISKLYETTFINTSSIGRYNLTVLANDTLGNLNNTESTYFNVQDIESPAYSNITETPSDPAVYSLGQVYNFTAVWTDNIQVDEVILEFDGTNYTTVPNGNIYSKTFNNLGVGTHNYTWYANDTSNNQNSTGQLNYTISQTASEVNLTLNSQDNNITIEVSSQVDIEARMVAPSAGKVELYQDGALISNGSSPLTNTTTYKLLGTYNITSVYPATQNYSSSSETHFITVQDTVNPSVSSITIIPGVINQTQTTTILASVTDNTNLTMQINITKPDSISSIFNMTKNGGTLWYYDYTPTTSDPAGNYNVTIIASDESGNVNSTETDFFTVYDITQPSTGITEPAENSTSNAGYSIAIKANAADETEVDSVYANLNWSSGYETVNLTYNASSGLYEGSFSDTTVSGRYNITAVAKDTSGNQYSNSSYFNIQDIESPAYSGLSRSPSSPAAYSEEQSYQFNAVWNDNVAIDKVLLEFNGQNYTVTTKSGDEYYYTWINLSISDHTYRWYANDTSGNLNNTDSFNYTVLPETTSPNITSTYIDPYAGAVGTGITLNMTAADQSNVSSTWAVITLPNTSTTTITTFPSNYTLTQTGRHNITFYANDTYNNIASSVADYFLSGTGANITINVENFNATDVETNLTIYLPGTTKEVDTKGFNGNYTKYYGQLLYDLYFTAYNGELQVILKNSNVSVNKTLGIDKLDTPINGYKVTYGIKSEFNQTETTLVFNYTTLSYTSQDYLSLDKCADWNFTAQNCSGTWAELSPTQDKDKETFTVTLSSLSGFSIKETIPAPAAASTGGGSSGSRCGIRWECGNWTTCSINGTQTRICEDKGTCSLSSKTEQQNCEYTEGVTPITQIPKALQPIISIKDYTLLTISSMYNLVADFIISYTWLLLLIILFIAGSGTIAVLVRKQNTGKIKEGVSQYQREMSKTPIEVQKDIRYQEQEVEEPLKQELKKDLEEIAYALKMIDTKLNRIQSSTSRELSKDRNKLKDMIKAVVISLKDMLHPASEELDEKKQIKTEKIQREIKRSDEALDKFKQKAKKLPNLTSKDVQSYTEKIKEKLHSIALKMGRTEAKAERKIEKATIKAKEDKTAEEIGKEINKAANIAKLFSLKLRKIPKKLADEMEVERHKADQIIHNIALRTRALIRRTKTGRNTINEFSMAKKIIRKDIKDIENITSTIKQKADPLPPMMKKELLEDNNQMLTSLYAALGKLDEKEKQLIGKIKYEKQEIKTLSQSIKEEVKDVKDAKDMVVNLDLLKKKEITRAAELEKEILKLETETKQILKEKSKLEKDKINLGYIEIRDKELKNKERELKQNIKKDRWEIDEIDATLEKAELLRKMNLGFMDELEISKDQNKAVLDKHIEDIMRHQKLYDKSLKRIEAMDSTIKEFNKDIENLVSRKESMKEKLRKLNLKIDDRFAEFKKMGLDVPKPLIENIKPMLKNMGEDIKHIELNIKMVEGKKNRVVKDREKASVKTDLYAQRISYKKKELEDIKHEAIKLNEKLEAAADKVASLNEWIAVLQDERLRLQKEIVENRKIIQVEKKLEKTVDKKKELKAIEKELRNIETLEKELKEKAKKRKSDIKKASKKIKHEIKRVRNLRDLFRLKSRESSSAEITRETEKLAKESKTSLRKVKDHKKDMLKKLKDMYK